MLLWGLRSLIRVSRVCTVSRCSRRAFQMSAKVYEEQGVDYEKWTKRQLIKKIKQLESGASVNGVSGDVNGSNGESIGDLNGAEVEKQSQVTGKQSQLKTKKELVFSEENTRFIGLKFAYLGWNYQGLAVQKEETLLPTVEQKLLEALHQVKMVPTLDVNDCSFSRCGRTDKGVSAMNQVVSLKVRSSLTTLEREDELNDAREMDYVNILNQVLPEDIRLHAVCLRPPKGFDARFSCRWRHYKYIFDGSDLDIQAMREAAKLFEGVHDFRNFCKVDGAKQLSNFEREILSSNIEPIHQDSAPSLHSTPGSKFYIFDLKGRAFLWHQVRCMMAILLMVGQKLESPSIITDLLDISKYTKKPQYIMANDLPLILYDCHFDENVKWIPTALNTKSARANNDFKGLQFQYNLRSIIFDIMHDVAVKPFDSKLDSKLRLDYGDGKGRFVNKNIPLDQRGTLGTPLEINEKWRMKNIKRKTIEEE